MNAGLRLTACFFNAEYILVSKVLKPLRTLDRGNATPPGGGIFSLS
jgi:hypothetical protein